MLVWFATLALLGIWQVVKAPIVLTAFSPFYALDVFTQKPILGFIVFGSVFLAVTGGEALYADMGHLGKKPIQYAWLFLVFPALLCNYAGQAALVIQDHSNVNNPFFDLAPHWMLIPMIALATLATIIASQALITGVFSITKQASLLNLLPRINHKQTSSEGRGQIYIPSVNWMLAAGTIAIALIFAKSDDLAAAYGVAVSATMLITTILLNDVAKNHWKWSDWFRLPLTLMFGTVDIVFLLANSIKIPEGGWIPLLAGACVLSTIFIWCHGAKIVESRLKKLSSSMPDFLSFLEVSQNKGEIIRCSGTGVFLTKVKNGAPPALLHHLHHCKSINKKLILLTVLFTDIPRVSAKERIKFDHIGNGVYRLEATYGFMQIPNVPVVMRTLYERGLIEEDPANITYYIGHERIVGNDNCKLMQGLPQHLFALMARNSAHPTDFFKIPDERVVEVGIRIEV
jgi:KUP system potassium uptake protein